MDDIHESSSWQPISLGSLQRMIDASLLIKEKTTTEYSEYDRLAHTFAAKHKDDTSFVRACLASMEGLEKHPLFQIPLPPPQDGHGARCIIEDPLMPSPLRVRKLSGSRRLQSIMAHPTFDTPSNSQPPQPAPGSSGRVLGSPFVYKSGDRDQSEPLDRERVFMPTPRSDIRTPSDNPFEDGYGCSSIIDLFDNLPKFPRDQDEEASGPFYTPCPSPRVLCQPDRDTGSDENVNDDSSQSAGGDEDSVDPTLMARTIKFNRNVELLRSHVQDNIAELRQHVEGVMDIQHIRRARKMQRTVSQWSFSPAGATGEMEEAPKPEISLDSFGNAVRKETKEERIMRLRAQDWKTVGPRSSTSGWKGAQYYQEFSHLVLNELATGR